MGLFNMLFGTSSKKKRENTDDTYLKDFHLPHDPKNDEIIVMARKRNQHNNVPLELSDKEIMYVSLIILKLFTEAGQEYRNEEISYDIILNITDQFLVLYQMSGFDFFHKHIKYELNKYVDEGLRDDYIQGRS